MHFDALDTVAFTGLAPPPFHVEGKPSRFVAPGPRFGQFRKPVPDRRERIGVGCRVRARRSADGPLVYVDNIVDEVHPVDSLAVLEGQDLPMPAAMLELEVPVKRFEHER